MKIIKNPGASDEKLILTGKDKVNAERLKRGEMFACPRCGEPLEFGADSCTNCHVFLDPSTRQVRGGVSDAELRLQIEDAKKKSRIGIAILAVGAVILTVGFMQDGSMNIILFIFAAALLLAGLFVYGKAGSRLKSQLNQTLVPEILSQLFDQVEYNPEGRISDEVINNTDMHFTFGFNRIYGNDYVKASYKGIGIEMSDITLQLEKKRMVRKENGDLEEEDDITTYFQGQWIIFDFHKELSADVCVFEGGRKWSDEGQIETENIAFNEKYGIVSESAHDVFYILTPHMMEHIMNMDNRARGDTYLRFLKEGKVHLAVNSHRNHFEVGSMKNADVDALRQKFKEEVQYVKDLIDELLKVNTIYKQ